MEDMENSDTSSRWAAARELATSLDDDSQREGRLTALPAAAAAAVVSFVELATEPTELAEPWSWTRCADITGKHCPTSSTYARRPDPEPRCTNCSRPFSWVGAVSSSSTVNGAWVPSEFTLQPSCTCRLQQQCQQQKHSLTGLFSKTNSVSWYQKINRVICTLLTRHNQASTSWPVLAS